MTSRLIRLDLLALIFVVVSEKDGVTCVCVFGCFFAKFLR